MKSFHSAHDGHAGVDLILAFGAEKGPPAELSGFRRDHGGVLYGPRLGAAGTNS